MAACDQQAEWHGEWRAKRGVQAVSGADVEVAEVAETAGVHARRE